MQIALTHKGQAALWVTNGCTSMSKPITTQSTPMGVHNNKWFSVGKEGPNHVRYQHRPESACVFMKSNQGIHSYYFDSLESADF